MNLDIYPVIVIYNKSISDSLTLRRLHDSCIPNNNVVVVDNSTADYNIGNYCQALGYNYISMNGNAGLSKAYNKALEYLKPIAGPDDLIMWLDDDTDVTREYFSVLCSNAENNLMVDIFMPIIIGQDGVYYSPNEGAFMKSRFITSVDEDIDMSKINGINSCLAVRYRIYNDYRYTEDLFMDLTDNQFFDDMRAKGATFKIIRTVIHQTFFQRGEDVNIDTVIKRFKLRIADFMIYARKKGKPYLFLALVKSYGWGIITSIKVNSPKVFWTCFIQVATHFIRNIVR